VVTVIGSATRASTAIALVAGASSVLLVGLASELSLAIGLLGWIALAGGLYRGSRVAISTALVCFWLAAAVAIGEGLPVEAVGLSVLAGVVAWDAGNRGVTLDRQLTTRAETARVELLHSGTTTIVGTGSLGIGYAFYSGLYWPHPPLATLLLVFSVVVLWVLLVRA
jgi:hypothetical protein